MDPSLRLNALFENVGVGGEPGLITPTDVLNAFAIPTDTPISVNEFREFRKLMEDLLVEETTRKGMSVHAVENLQKFLNFTFSNDILNGLSNDGYSEESVRVLLSDILPASYVMHTVEDARRICTEILWDSGASIHVTDYLSSLIKAVKLTHSATCKGVGGSKLITHKGNDPRMAGISYYIQSLHDGVRQCILSVGTHCQANANGATSSFMFKRTRAFCHNDTPATDAIGEELWQLVKGKPGTMVAVCTPQMVYEQTADPEQQAQAQYYRDVFLSNKCASAQAQSSSLPPDNIGGGGALRSSAAVGGSSVFMLKTDLSSVHQTRSVTTSSNGLRTRSGAGGGSAVQREGTRSLRPRGDDVRERNDQGNYVVSKSGASVGPTTASTLLAVSHTEASVGNRLSTTGSESSHAGRSIPSTSVSNIPIQVASSDRGTARRTGALDTRGSGSVVWTRAVNGTITSSTYRGPTSLNCGGAGVSMGLTASAALDCRGVSSGMSSNSGASKSASSFGSGREMDSWHESSARPNSVKSSSAVSRNNPTVGIRVWSHRTSAAANFTSVSSAINRERAASRRFNESSARSGVSRHVFPNWNEPMDGCDGYFNRNGPPNL